ncbi:Beta-barrel assembly-enhancing protease [compost metagenome]
METPLTGAALVALFMARAEAHRQDGEPERAEEALRSALLVAPGDGLLHLSLSMAIAARAGAQAALPEAEAARRLAPEVPAVCLWLGLLQMDLGAHQQAERHLLEALRLDADHALGYHLYALLMFRTGRLEKAEALLGEALRLEPAFAEAHGTLALVLAERNKTRDAHHAGQTSVLLAPGREGSHVAAGLACMENGDPYRARDHFREALRLDAGRGRALELFLEADRACRWIYWPFYQWTRLVARLPGQQFTVWAGVLVLVMGLSSAGVPRGLLGTVLLPYVVFVIYTWLATPLVAGWTRLRPPVR